MLKDEELVNINGGALHWGIYAAAIAAAVSFVVGFFDGLVRPFNCR